MKIVIPGGSGQVGTLLARAFHADGHDVVVLSRRLSARPWRVVEWDGVSLGAWQSEIDGCDVVINLAGRSVNCRYTAKNRDQILQSRVLSTRVIGQAIANASRPPRVWLQASTATIYAHRYDAPNDEYSGILGGSEPHAPASWRFSIHVARAWEDEFDKAIVARTRKIAMRSAMTWVPILEAYSTPCTVSSDVVLAVVRAMAVNTCRGSITKILSRPFGGSSRVMISTGSSTSPHRTHYRTRSSCASFAKHAARRSDYR